MFFCEEEGTQSSFTGVKDVIGAHGLFCSLYTDRASHYWHTPKAGGKVDKVNLTQFGRAMRQLGIEMIPAYSPEVRGRSERAFGTHQGRLPKELAAVGITTWMPPMRICATSTCRRLMRSLPIRPGRTARPSCRARPQWSWTTSWESPHRIRCFRCVSVLRQKRTIHLLQNRTNLFVANTRYSVLRWRLSVFNKERGHSLCDRTVRDKRSVAA